MSTVDERPGSVNRPVFFITDFGSEDEFAGVCHAVIDRIAPEVKVIDLTHGIEPGDIRRAAMALAAALPYCAPAVFLAVVDPGVGTDRRAVVVRAGEHLLVGPDNGLLWLAIEQAGGATAVWDISGSPAWLERPKRTFHGRDLFSPVAAKLALGQDPAELGAELDPGNLQRLELPVARLAEGQIEATVLARDRYGNLALNLGPDLIEDSFLAPGVRVRIEVAGSDVATVPLVGAFGEVAEGEAMLYPDSSGSLSLAINRGDASATFGLAADDILRLTPD